MARGEVCLLIYFLKEEDRELFRRRDQCKGDEDHSVARAEAISIDFDLEEEKAC